MHIPTHLAEVGSLGLTPSPGDLHAEAIAATKTWLPSPLLPTHVTWDWSTTPAQPCSHNGGCQQGLHVHAQERMNEELGDVWSFDLSHHKWTQLLSSPPPRV